MQQLMLKSWPAHSILLQAQSSTQQQPRGVHMTSVRRNMPAEALAGGLFQAGHIAVSALPLQPARPPCLPSLHPARHIMAVNTERVTACLVVNYWILLQ